MNQTSPTKFITWIPSDALAGGASGFVICILLQPLEIIKVCLIVNPMRLATIEKANFATSFRQSVKLIYEKEGFKGFWRGLTPALLRLCLGSAVYFQVLSDLNKTFHNLDIIGKKSSDFLASGLARTTSSLVCNPLTVIRTRFEMVGFTEYNNLLDAIRKIKKTEGIRGFFKGSLTCIFRDGPFAGLYYLLLNIAKKELQPLNMSASATTMTAGMLSGIISTTLTHPFEVLRTKLQVDMSREKKNSIGHGGIIKGLHHIWINEGIFGLMKGLAPRLMRKPLANALTFTTYEIFKKNPGEKDKKHS